MQLVYFVPTVLWLVRWAQGEEDVDAADRAKRTIIGFFPACPRGCSSCSDTNGCVTCRRGFFLQLRREGIRQTGECVRNCPAGFFGIRRRQFSKCYRCGVSHCEACFSRTYCTRCSAPYLANQGRCIDQCPANLYYATYSKECLPTVDCVLGQWEAWGPCTRRGQTCGYKYGVQSRARAVLQLPSPAGVQCPMVLESQRCRMAFRSCVDLQNNNSDPSRAKMPWRKKKRRRRKNKDKPRDRNRKKEGKKDRQRRRKNKRRRNRNRKREQIPLPIDVATNQISALPSV